jgi:aerobic C4-dicarboxylate transport protein
VFSTIVVGIAGAQDIKKIGKAGGLALLYFELGSSIALLLGLFVINVLRPGVGMNVDPSTLDISALASYTQAPHHTFSEFLLNVITLQPNASSGASRKLAGASSTTCARRTARAFCASC